MTGRHSVEKIGGTSMAATSTLFDNVLIARILGMPSSVCQVSKSECQ